jgi:hypothetical protein
MSTANKAQHTPGQLETIRHAAPELLEALEALVDHMITMNDGGDAENNPDVVRGLSAIAKARGRGNEHQQTPPRRARQ